jgi:hypothetical protein
MSNFELIDEYLTGRLQGEDKVTFENQMANDPALKSEVELQKQIVDAIRKTRAAELKTMLNNVPVGTTIQADFSILRMAAGLAGAGVLAASLYFYFKPEIHLEDASTDILKKTEQFQENNGKPNTGQTPEVGDSAASSGAKTETPLPKAANPKVTPNTTEVKPKEVQKPALQLTDPSGELDASDNENSNPATQSVGKTPTITTSQVVVDVDSSNKKYGFHYQFVNEKLMLFGTFDKSLYEVIEIHGVDHSLFLYYRDQYYLLDQLQHEITKLTPIKDTALLSKLKEFRN